MRTTWLAAAAVAALASGASAEDATAIGELVVTGARLEESLPQELARYGSDLAVIDEATIRNQVYVDISQALQMQTPGLFLSPRNGPFSYVDIAIQGSRTGDVLWLVDGVRISNRLYASTSPADTLPASMVERIEVLKGGQSLFYGTQAVAGAINVVTRGFSEDFDGRFTAGGDTHRGVHADVYARDTIGRHRFVAWATKDESDGYRTFDTFQPSATDRRRGYDVVSFGGKYGLELADGLVLNLYAQHIDAHLEYPNPRLTRLAFNDRDEEIASLSLDWTAREDVQVSVKGYYHDWDSVYSTVENRPDGSIAIVDDLTYWGYEDFGVQALARLNLHKGFEYQLGYDFQNFNGRDEVLLIAEQTEKVHALIGQIRTTDDLFQYVRFAAGLRHNRTGETDKTVWNVSGRWDATPKLFVEGMVGTAFILPSAEQLFGIDLCCAIGNPKLDAEESMNGSLSVGGEADRVSWKVTAFAREVTNLIVDDYDQPGFADGIYINTDAEVRFRGVELQGTVRFTDELHARASYAHTRARAAGAGRQFDRVPRDQVKAGLDYAPDDRPFAAAASLLWVGDVSSNVSGFGQVEYGDYVVVDLAAHVYLDGAERRHKLTARLENALDAIYATRVNSALIDGSLTARFLYRFRGAPRTLHASYAYSF